VKKPELEDFDLTKDEVTHLVKIENRYFVALFWGSVVVAILLVTLWMYSEGEKHYTSLSGGYIIKRDLTTAIIQGVFVGGILGVFLGLVLRAIFASNKEGFSRELGNLDNYRRAKKDYDEWFTRTKTIFWNSLSGRQFEREVALLFSKMGYEVHLTPAVGDEGIDILLLKNGERIAVQCKAHKKCIGPHVARELYGAMVHSGIRKGIIVSAGGFSKGVFGFIDLMDLSDIMKIQRNLEE
jgi:hypothetical protein